MFGKKKKMVDIRELQRRGIVRPPKNDDVIIPTNREGFVDLGSSSKPAYPVFFNKQKSSGTTSSQGFSTEKEGYSKRDVDTKITELDNKIYKLEQRIELLERKNGVNQQNLPDTSVLGW
jgi:hypothetical protein